MLRSKSFWWSRKVRSASYRDRNLVCSVTPVAHSKLFALSVALLVLVSNGTGQQSSTKAVTKSYEVSGFLDDYSGMYPDAKNSDLLVYVKEKGILKRYDKFIVDPVAIQLTAEAESRGLDPLDLKLLADDCREALVKELRESGHYQVVTAPGPGVVHLRAALTDVEPTRNRSNAAVKAGTIAASTAVAPGAALLIPRPSVGGASIEAEMLDSQSGERLAAAVTTARGRRFFSGLRGMKKWGDAESAFKQWARAFRERLDEVHGMKE